MVSANVLLMVTGGIAAYKACFLARLLVQAGFSVKVAMTEAATRFVNPLTFQVLTGHPVATDLWGERQTEPLDHIEYSRWADLVVIAPATANCLAKAATGIADDMVSTLLLAHDGPLLFAPAMNDKMWKHPATQANRTVLADRGASFVGPGEGFLACGTNDTGRMVEPESILAAVREVVVVPASSAENSGFWTGRKIVITAGPTYEPIDPVRFVANRSSGIFGYALAAAAVAEGARVTLISGPVANLAPRGLDGFQPVESGREMADAVAAALTADADWLFMAAAVADFRPTNLAESKLKKDELGKDWSLNMVRNPDILGEVVPLHRSVDLRVVGFALETDDLLARAEAKCQAKNMDYVVANDPTAPGSGFGSGDHQVTLLNRRGEVWASDSAPKSRLAAELLQQLALDQMDEKS
ncbi:MAG: bifunctional phosphopantothenoylcysteine decarboxylase/phosphopantothenate--cysteine ligase CoaBC [Gemmatimonadales bacterium]|nr:bifunctional phosphopantothenoylcysteine decarboxylase/phosphopantothenate--cysteine ligase CoaBC [Gemmatimonadales bacterium]